MIFPHKNPAFFWCRHGHGTPHPGICLCSYDSSMLSPELPPGEFPEFGGAIWWASLLRGPSRSDSILWGKDGEDIGKRRGAANCLVVNYPRIVLVWDSSPQRFFVDIAPTKIPFITRVGSPTYDPWDEPPSMVHVQVRKLLKITRG